MADAEDINEWVFKIEKLIKDKILSKKLSNNSFRKYNQNYTWEIRAERVLKMIKNIS